MTYRLNSVFPALPADPAPVKVLAFDQSTSCGWAIMGTDMPKPLWGVLKLPTGDDETPALRLLYEHMSWAVAEHGVSHVYFEQPIIPQHQATMGTLRQAMYVAAIQLASSLLLERSAEQVPMSSWREKFIGTGRAPSFDIDRGRKLETSTQRRAWWKRSAIAACLERGWLVDDDNAAEAIGIATYGLICLSPAFRARQGPLFRRAEMEASRIR